MKRREEFCVVLIGLLLGSCFLRTPYLLDKLNEPGGAGASATPPTMAARISILTKQHLVDAYVDPKLVAEWLANVKKDKKPMITLVRKALEAISRRVPSTKAFDDFMAAVSPQNNSSAWSLPAPPAAATKPTPTNAAFLVELDVERFVANARALAFSLAALSKVTGLSLTDADLVSGIGGGCDRAAAYLRARKWTRSPHRPTTAIVISGGAANGAYGAGFIWRLMKVLAKCWDSSKPGEGCSGAKIDMVAGTSTGALIGYLLDLFHTKAARLRAQELLVSSYTCSTEAKLYCVNSRWDWALGDDLKGLVRFNGIESKLSDTFVADMLTNDLEQVSVSVDLESGRVFTQSDQDPEDFPPGSDLKALRVQGVLASIVEPVLAEPVQDIGSNTKGMFVTKGVFVDGGLRSGLPVLEAINRGAERVLVISNSGIEAGPAERPKNALKILFRTLDLLVGQARVAEVQQAEFGAIERRLIEYSVCNDRLKGNADATAVGKFCKRSPEGGFGPQGGVQAATSSWIGPASFEEVSSSWQSSWVYWPENLRGLDGYKFDPKKMRELFAAGVGVFQARCAEVTELLGISGSLTVEECNRSADDVAKDATSAVAKWPIEECTKNSDIPTCD